MNQNPRRNKLTEFRVVIVVGAALLAGARTTPARLGETQAEIAERYGAATVTNEMAGLEMTIHRFKGDEIWCLYMDGRCSGEILLSTNAMAETTGKAIAEKVIGKPLEDSKIPATERLRSLGGGELVDGSWKSKDADEATLSSIAKYGFRRQLMIVSAKLAKKLASDQKAEDEEKERKERAKSEGF